jgi:hypothetical protein
MRQTVFCFRLLGLPEAFEAAARSLAPKSGIVHEFSGSVSNIGPQTLRRRDIVIAAGMDAAALGSLPAAERILLCPGELPRGDVSGLTDAWICRSEREFSFRLELLCTRKARGAGPAGASGRALDALPGRHGG